MLDPEADLEKWTLTVEGDVQHPGEYRLSQIQTLPKISQNTRHVCVEGWDVVGSFGGARISDFLTLVGANTGARFAEGTGAQSETVAAEVAPLLTRQVEREPASQGQT